jgi:soluble lytic murein transglycosylase-like protein
MLRTIIRCVLVVCVCATAVQPAAAQSRPPGFSAAQPSQLDALIAQHATANGLPRALVDRIIKRESGGNPRAVSGGNYGLMQIRLGTARALGYSGPATGLLDPETNMTYAMRYLAGAYSAAHGNEARAMALYSHGY